MLSIRQAFTRLRREGAHTKCISEPAYIGWAKSDLLPAMNPTACAASELVGDSDPCQTICAYVDYNMLWTFSDPGSL